ncbi:pilus assembly protein TadG-related protein [Erwinia sp.]|uniref:TadE/TadG family type IV pilus assembly protein n=1 Tax=Erwinia citreus TaxID=558 RepID=UPI003C724A01
MNLLSHSLMSLQRLRDDQRGAFAVTFVMLSGFLLGVIALGLEGSRYIIERARLSDAMEQAALALSAEDNGNGAARNDRLAADYLSAYMRHDIAVYRPDITFSSGVSSTNLSYVEYRVRGQTLQESWFASSLFPSFDQQQRIGENGAARKYRSSIDVIFVTDFSGSMKEIFAGRGSKLYELKRIVLKLARELYSYDAGNQAGFIPFGWGGKQGNRCDFPFVITSPVPPNLLQEGISSEIEDYIDIKGTVAAIPNEVNEITFPLSNVGESACLKGSVSSQVPLTSELAKFSKIESMTAMGGTLVSSGVLLGAKELVKGKATRKVLVIVSDGKDDPAKITLTPRLINAGMCDRIRQAITTPESVGKIAFIGIGYKPTVDWKRCVGDKNFYLSHNVSSLEDYLHRAVFEEVGHNVIKD